MITSMKLRINKFVSQSTGLARRKVDELVLAGRVTVNGIVAKHGDLVDSTLDIVTVDGTQVKSSLNKTFDYFLLNKPVKVLSSVSDDRGRLTVGDLLAPNKGIFPVGRLDYMSSGLILLTNDGDLAFKMTHPKFHIAKRYLVTVKENIEKGQLNPIRNGGIPIEDKLTSKTELTLLDNHTFEITLYEGIKRQIRLSCRYVGLTVVLLKRLTIGELQLDDLPEGKFRVLTSSELTYINSLKENAIPYPKV